MTSFSKALGISASGMRVQTERLQVVAQNVANTDTPGFQRKLVTFKSEADKRSPSSVGIDKITLDRRPGEQIYDPGHPMADASGHYTGSNVDLVLELADAREAQRSYEANLKMFDQTRQMSSGLMELLRK